MKSLAIPALLLSTALPLAACSSTDTDNPAGLIEVTASGEILALRGFDFPASGDSPFFVDGWEVRLQHMYVTLDNIVVSEDPDLAPADQLQKGRDVARASGPWVVDLAKGGPVPGKGQDVQAVKITELPNQTENGGQAFVADRKYAFGYDFVRANDASVRINLTADDEANHAEMIEHGYTVMYVGTATFRGTSCTPADDEHLAELPTTVHFQFGFDAPTTYVNCQNPELGGDAHDSPRGVALKANQATVAQITVHPDHPFWDARIEDAPLRFDAFAFVAHARGKGSAGAPLTMDDLAGVPFTPVALGGETLHNRTCSPASAPSSSELSYDPRGESFADLAGFMRYLQRSQGHFNGDGLCAVAGIEHSHDHGDDHDHDHDHDDDHDHDTNDGGSCAASGDHCSSNEDCCSNDCHDDHCH